MLPSQFITAYQTALATQQWQNVEPLIHEDCCVTFSNGEVHKGISAVKAAYERNFAHIKNEDYQLTNLQWISITETTAEYTFHFRWTGTINGQAASGAGKGKAVIALSGGHWKLMEECLSKAEAA